MPDLTTLLSKFLADLYSGTIGNTSGVNVALKAGTAAAPSLTFASDTDTGFADIPSGASGNLILSLDGTARQVWFGASSVLGGNETFGWASGDPYSTAMDTILVRDGAADTLALKNGNNPQTQRWYSANAGNVGITSLTELTTIAAAASTDTTIQMPANAVILGVTVRVTTVIPTAATFTVGDSGSAARFNTVAVSTAANSTDPGTKAGAYYNASALAIRITPNLQPADNTGRVRVTIYYYTVTPPTS